MIWKYEIQPFMQMPKGFKILSVQWQNDQLMLWALVDPEAPQVSIEMIKIETGRKFSKSELYTYLETFQLKYGVFHLFWREL